MSSDQGSQSDAVDAASGDGSDAPKPEIKRRKLLDPGGPVEDDETARQKMRNARVYARGVHGYVGFDPKNVADVKSTKFSGTRDIKPMGYFAQEGDLPMMRWLYVNGADTRDEDMPVYFPMLLAARKGRMDLCKWLFDHGAAKDIKRRTITYFDSRPLRAAFGFSNQLDFNLCKWFILNGALCKDDDSGELDVEIMMRDLGWYRASAKEQPYLLTWARQHHQSRSSVDVFLMGTLSAPTYSEAKLRESLFARIHSTEAVDRLLGHTPPDEYPLLWGEIFPQRVGCPLEVFAGKSGILELIGDYVGIFRGCEACIVRQLTDILPGVIARLDAEMVALYIEGLPDIDDSNDSNDSDSDDSDSE